MGWTRTHLESAYLGNSTWLKQQLTRRFRVRPCKQHMIMLQHFSWARRCCLKATARLLCALPPYLACSMCTNLSAASFVRTGIQQYTAEHGGSNGEGLPVAFASKVVGLVMPLAQLADHDSMIHLMHAFLHLRPEGTIWKPATFKRVSQKAQNTYQHRHALCMLKRTSKAVSEPILFSLRQHPYALFVEHRPLVTPAQKWVSKPAEAILQGQSGCDNSTNARLDLPPKRKLCHVTVPSHSHVVECLTDRKVSSVSHFFLANSKYGPLGFRSPLPPGCGLSPASINNPTCECCCAGRKRQH